MPRLEPAQISEHAPGVLSSASDALRFMFAGNATFTLRSAKTGARFTYRLRRKDETTPFFASVLAGQNNETDYDYIGFVSQDDRARLIAGAKGKPGAPSFRALAWALAQLSARSQIPPLLEVYHEGRCCACGRKLTTPESVLSGIGPECAKKGL